MRRTIQIAAIMSVLALVAIEIIAYAIQRSDSSVLLRPDDPVLVSRGKAVYGQACASCHGNNLEGQPNWRQRDAQGFLPAPPHDDSGHTWHHSDEVLFDLTKNGMQKYAGPDYKSAMPAFGGRLSDDDIVAALSYISSTWSNETLKRRQAANGRSGQQ